MNQVNTTKPAHRDFNTNRRKEEDVEENKKIVAEMLMELEDMTPEEIEDFRPIWILELKRADIGKDELLESIANAVCDVAIERAKRKAANT